MSHLRPSSRLEAIASEAAPMAGVFSRNDSGIAPLGRSVKSESNPPGHATLSLMSSAVPPALEDQSLPPPRERPWLFAFLIAPDAVISIGLVSGALTYLLRNEGVDPARAAGISRCSRSPTPSIFSGDRSLTSGCAAAPGS